MFFLKNRKWRKTRNQTVDQVKKKEEFKDMFYGSATVGTKGQIVIPAKLRRDSDIKPGDTLIFISRPRHGGFHVMKPEELLRLRKEFERLQGQVIGKIKKVKNKRA